MQRVSTSAEWLACTDPLSLVNAVAGRASDRKLRLLLAACCRRPWYLIQDRRLWEALDLAERFADGLAAEGERLAAARGVEEAVQDVLHSQSSASRAFAWIGRAIGLAYMQRGDLSVRLSSAGGRYGGGSYTVMQGLDQIANAVAFRRSGEAPGPRLDPFAAPEREGQCQIVRDVFGDPFRPVPADDSWLTWQDGTVVKVAGAIYHSKTFDHLPVLADALEEAGCDTQDLLQHLRSPGPHVRGCWALDLALGNE